MITVYAFVAIEQGGVSALVTDGFNSAAGSLSIVDLTNGTVIPVTTDLRGPEGVVAESLNAALVNQYSSTFSSRELSRVNLLTGQVTTISSFGVLTQNFHGVALESGGLSALTSAGELFRIDLVSGNATQITSATLQAGDVAIESPGDTALVTTPKGVVRVQIKEGVPSSSPVLTVNPPLLDFFTVTVGTSLDKTFTVLNTGGGILTGNVSTSAPFSIIGNGSFGLGANESTTFTVRFTPTSAITFNGNVSITSDAGDGAVILTGTGTLSAALSVIPTSLDFLTVTVGASKDLTFTIQNSGGGALSGGASTNSAGYSIVGDSSFSLGANESKVITVRFSPTSAITFNGNVSVTSNGGNASVTLTGTGVFPPHIDMLSPVFGPPGSELTLLGSDFGTAQDSSTVKFGTSIAVVSFWTNSEIHVTVPLLPTGNYELTVTTAGGTSNSVPFLLTAPLGASDFRIAVEPPSQTVNQGSSTQYRILIEAINGFDSPVTFSALGLPAGTAAQFSVNPASPTGDLDAIITTTATTPIGKHLFSLQGSVNGFTRTVTAELVVKRSKEAVLSLNRSFSAEKPLLLTFQYRRQDAEGLTAVVTLWNQTGAWLTATRHPGTGIDHPVIVNEQKVPSVVLLGPYASLSLGEITFKRDQSLQYTGRRDTLEAGAAFVLDLFLRSLLGRVLPADVFIDAYSAGDFALNTSGKFLSAIAGHCTAPLVQLIDPLLLNPSVSGLLAASADILHCSDSVRREISLVAHHILKNGNLTSKVTETLDASLGTILAILQSPTNILSARDLLCPSFAQGVPITGFIESLGFCATIGSPIEGFVRLEAR